MSLVSLHASGVSRSHRARTCARPRWFIPYTVATRWGWYTMVVEHDRTTPDGRGPAGPPDAQPTPHGRMHVDALEQGLNLAR